MDEITVVVDGVGHTAEYAMYGDNELHIYLPDGTVKKVFLRSSEGAPALSVTVTVKSHLRQWVKSQT